jgi:hypothetical protein
LLLGGLPLNSTAAALDAAMSASSGGGEARAAPEAPPAQHWALDDILWSPEAVAAISATPGSGGGALRPALLATPEGGAPKQTPAVRRPPLRAHTCQAMGCHAPLEAPYYLRNRLCPAHVRAEQLWLTQEGPPLRFCQVRWRRTPGNARPHTLPLHVLGTYALPFITPARRSATGATMLPPSTA